MSAKVTGMVFDRYPAGGGEMLLALALADHAHDDGTRIFPSVARLAAKTRQSERAVQYQLRRMEQSGWLILVNAGTGGRQSGFGEGGKTREYRISSAWMKGEDFAPLVSDAVSVQKGADSAPLDYAKGANDDTQGCKPAHERVQIDAEKGAKLLHPNQEQPSLRATKSNHQSIRAKPTRSADRFDAFWSAYPVKVAKRQCLDKWKALNLDALGEQILADVLAKAKSDRRWSDGFIPNPLTYLNQERWNDPVQPRLTADAAPSGQSSRNRQSDIEQKNRSVAAEWARANTEQEPSDAA